MEPTVPGRNGGRLHAGGVPGNRGGKGAIPKTLRAKARERWAQAIDRIGDIADGTADGTAPNESVAAWNALGKYGMGELNGVSIDDKETARTAVKMAHSIYGPDRLPEFTEALLNALGIVIEEDGGDDS